MNPAPLLALAALLLPPPAPLSAESAGREVTKSELMSYIQDQDSDPACGVCLKAAHKYLADKTNSDLAKKTEGLAFIPAGAYRVGSPEGVGDSDERPAAEVSLDAFYIEKTEVTLKDYEQFVKLTGSNYPEWEAPNGKFNLTTGSDDYYRRMGPLIKTCRTCPVFGVSWGNARAYCAWKKRRLPTEAEWETAARAGSKEAYSFGDQPAVAGAYAWNETNSQEKPHPVGQKKPNKNGLFDMHGNVWEWMYDYYEKTYYAERPARNPQGPRMAKERVIRGGSWSTDTNSSRSGNRASSIDPNDDIGFRCAVSESDLSQQHDGGL